MNCRLQMLGLSTYVLTRSVVKKGGNEAVLHTDVTEKSLPVGTLRCLSPCSREL